MSVTTILLIVAAVGYVLYSRMQGQALTARRLLVIPVILLAIGVGELGNVSATGVAFLVAAGATSLALGAARGATVAVYARNGVLWYRYHKSTVVLWVLTIAVRAGLVAAATAVGLPGEYGMLISLGLSLLGESAVVGTRAHATGIPFAPTTSRRGRGGHDGIMTSDAGPTSWAAPDPDGASARRSGRATRRR